MIAKDNLNLQTNDQLISAAVSLGAQKIEGFSDAEELLVAPPLPAIGKATLDKIRLAIKAGHDPLGIAYCRINSPVERRSMGAVYTPQPIVDAMLRWSKARSKPERIVDAGTGTGRFLLASGILFKEAKLI